eukprot:CAMPEP_0180529936 /NCGR_PEP_ID=MMETSP1036_2-20121128/61648_1 /TAXON_ID=632150 /ORGANISM="Azadinium spinosum, Strain 3D9" /LENGTH=54 /DNA_ID=CAMNT_0022543697 /DNA_START=192 /DNA_END=356 /DNA_ORIENTATION=+
MASEEVLAMSSGLKAKARDTHNARTAATPARCASKAMMVVEKPGCSASDGQGRP